MTGNDRKKVFVLAANYMRFMDWIRPLKFQDPHANFFWVSDPNRLEGHRVMPGDELHMVDGWEWAFTEREVNVVFVELDRMEQMSGHRFTVIREGAWVPDLTNPKAVARWLEV